MEPLSIFRLITAINKLKKKANFEFGCLWISPYGTSAERRKIHRRAPRGFEPQTYGFLCTTLHAPLSNRKLVREPGYTLFPQDTYDKADRNRMMDAFHICTGYQLSGLWVIQFTVLVEN